MANGRGSDLASFVARHVPHVSYRRIVEQISTRSVRALYESSPPLSADTLKHAAGVTRPRLLTQLAAAVRSANITAVAFPTTVVTAPLIRWDVDDGGDQFELIRNTAGTAALGIPGLSLPIGESTQGLPVGLELDALPGQDRDLIAIGIAIEQALGPLSPPASIVRQ